MPRLAVALALGLALSLVAPIVSAHSPGSPPITASGSFLLGEAHGTNSSFHAYIATLGIPPGPGDTLRFSWSANGGVGPPISFNIHSHPANSTNTSLNYSTTYYDAIADRVDDAWIVCGSGSGDGSSSTGTSGAAGVSAAGVSAAGVSLGGGSSPMAHTSDLRTSTRDTGWIGLQARAIVFARSPLMIPFTNSPIDCFAATSTTIFVMIVRMTRCFAV